MKLYSANLSPYAARVRLAMYAKEIPVEVLMPPGGPKSPEYLAINPIGKLPCLAPKDGFVVPESGVILEYLEDSFPEITLLPGSPDHRARIRLVARVSDLYVAAPGHVLFGQMNPATRDQSVVDAQLARLDEGLAWLDCQMDDGAFAIGDDLTIADCYLVPVLLFLGPMCAAFGRSDIATRHPRIAGYIAKVKGHRAVARVCDELTTAMAHFQATGQLS